MHTNGRMEQTQRSAEHHSNMNIGLSPSLELLLMLPPMRRTLELQG